MSDTLRHTSFFRHMEEFGYFSGIEEALPEAFTSVFEIARVLEDEESALFQKLASVLTVASAPPTVKKEGRTWQPNRRVPPAAEFDVDFIQSVSDVRKILATQYVLPDEVFLRRLARRELLMRVAKHPTILPFGNTSTDYSPNSFKQKIYLLLDTSTSMLSHHRFQMAKAIAYVFLKRNLRELGHIYFRTFDVELGPLVTATDMPSLRTLIRDVMLLRKLGNGTAMQKAILQACEDIREKSALSDAEILIITDGAAHLDKEALTAALGTTIRLNAIKIGDATLNPDDRFLADEATRTSGAKGKTVRDLEERIRRCENDLRNASPSQAERIRGELSGLQSQLAKVRSQLVDSMRAEYGREIESLARVFVQIEDIVADGIFELSDEQIEELRELVRQAAEAMREGFDAATLKEVALLYEHISMLLDEKVIENEGALREMQNQLSDLIDDFVQSTARTVGMAARKLKREDLRDLGMMLQHRSLQQGGLLAALMAILRKLLTMPRLSKLKVLRRR